MKVLFSPNRDGLPEFHLTPTIFLAGPTHRTRDKESWRLEAIREFESFAFDGVLFVPEPASGKEWDWDYGTQVAWEHRYLSYSSWIMFWVPRDMDLLPGMTTNIEWGMYWDSGKVNLGFPAGTPHMTYMNWCAKKIGVPVTHTLKETVDAARKGALKWVTGEEIP